MKMSRRVLLNLAAAACIALAGAGAVASAAGIRTVAIMDQCDPATFDAAVGPGTCVGNAGGVPFDTFVAEVTKTQQAGAWHFAPGVVRMRDGEALQARNNGGETHTFTQVAQFGGGFIDFLNQLSGNPVPAPECNPVTNPEIQFVAPGEKTDPDFEEPGVHHYQCCIHPWMRTDIIVR
jgi:plastocyanin